MLLALAAALTASPLVDAGVRARCPANPRVFEAAGTAGTLKRLDELPPAAHVLTLYREVGRCAEPVVLRGGIGNVAPGR